MQHDDLHAGNVLPAAHGVGGDRFFDWGDAAVAHPFGTLLVTLRSMAATLGLRPDDAALRRVRDAYLDAWGVEPGAGVRAARLAAWTGCVGRAPRTPCGMSTDTCRVGEPSQPWPTRKLAL